jgi:hypothetical protein
MSLPPVAKKMAPAAGQPNLTDATDQPHASLRHQTAPVSKKLARLNSPLIALIRAGT